MRGQTILVTGATSGIGFQAALVLAGRGARVVMVGRDPARSAHAAAEVAARTGSTQVSHLLCDFSSLADVRRLAETVRARHSRLDVLVNNAGGVHRQRRLTVDGIETTFAVNHLGGFLLTNLLLDTIVRSAPARIVTVASIAHRQATLDFDDLSFARGGYSIMRAYGRSKLANVLFAAELARRLARMPGASGAASAYPAVTSNSVHPGMVDTHIWAGAPIWAKPIIQIAMRPFFLTAAQGAAHVLDLITRPDLAAITGRYFEEARMVDAAPLARHAELAARLWEVSAAMVGLPPDSLPPRTRS